MNYFVKHGEERYGPYSLSELQQQVQSGKFSISALTQSEGMTDWVPISQVLGNIPIPTTAAAPSVTPQVQTVPLPPNMHWGVLLLLVAITQQLFNFVWALVLANWARKLERNNNALVLVAMYPAGIVGGVIASANENETLSGLLIVAGAIAYIVGVFSILSAIVFYYSSR